MAESTSKVKTVVEVSSNAWGACRFCHYSTPHSGDVPAMVNHYIQGHGFELLHVGQETSRADDGSPWQSTVAVLGTSQAISEKPPARLALPDKDPIDG